MLTWEQVQQAEAELADEHRIKKNVDYAVTLKYGALHVLCCDVFEDTVREVFKRHNISIIKLLTYH